MKKHLMVVAVLGAVAWGAVARAADAPATQPKTEAHSITIYSGGGRADYTAGSSGNGQVMVRANSGGGGGGSGVSFGNGAMKMKMEKAAWLGVMTSPAPEALLKQLKIKCGLLVQEVIPDSPASKAGLKPDDLLEKIDDQLLVNPAQLQSLVQMHNPGDSVALSVMHEGDRRTVPLTLVEHEVARVSEFGGSWSGNTFEPDSVMPRFLTNGGPGGIHPRPGSNIVSHFESRMDDGKYALTLVRQGDSRVLTINDASATGSLPITSTYQGNSRVLTINDASGKQIFQGPVDTAEQQAKIPADLQGRFHEMLKMQDMTEKPAKP
jgi:hypothetical protein